MPTRRAPALLTAAAIALTGATAVVLLHGQPHNGRRHPVTPAPATSRPARDPARAPPPAPPAGPARAAGTTIELTGLRWPDFDGIALPVSAQDGQHNIRGGLASGYTDTARGALLAAINIAVLNRLSSRAGSKCTGGSFTGPGPSGDSQRGHAVEHPRGNAIEAIAATIRGGMDLGWASISPSVDFTNASTTFLTDDPAKWPPRFVISGFTYDRFEQPQDTSSAQIWDRAARCAWLASQALYDSGPYKQAARVFHQHGYTRQAEEILLALLYRAGDAAHASLGYGYRPARVLWLLGALLLLVIVVKL